MKNIIPVIGFTPIFKSMTYLYQTPSQEFSNSHKRKNKGAVSRASLALKSAPRKLRKPFKGRLRALERHQRVYERLSHIIDNLNDEDLGQACGRYVTALNAASKRVDEIDSDICKKLAEAQKQYDERAAKRNGGISDAQFDEDITALCGMINQIKAAEEAASKAKDMGGGDKIKGPFADRGKPPTKLK